MLSQIADIVGLIGVTMILLAYYLLNANKVNVLSLFYQYLNLAGSILILFSLCFNVNLASIVIEVFWIAISAAGLRRAYREMQKPPAVVV